MRIRSCVWVVLLAAFAVAPAPALASPALLMSVTPLAPVAGGTITATNAPPVFQVRVDDPSFGASTMRAAVANSPATTDDGLLTTANIVATGGLPYGEDNPDIYTGPVAGAYAATAGSYWVQYSYVSSDSQFCGPAGPPCTAASQVIAFTVSGTAPPGEPTTPPDSGTGETTETPPVATTPTDALKVWPIADARATIPGIIREGTKRSARALTRKCSRAGLYGFQCRSTWHDAVYNFNGIFRLRIDSRTREVRYRYYGKRASRRCLKKAKYKSHCQFDWAF